MINKSCFQDSAEIQKLKSLLLELMEKFMCCYTILAPIPERAYYSWGGNLVQQGETAMQSRETQALYYWKLCDLFDLL